MVKILLRKLMVAPAVLLAYGSAYSQADTSKLQEVSLKDLLNARVVTAAKVSQELQQAPATIVVVTKEQIRSRGYQSLLDVMHDLPDVKVDDKIYSGIRNNFTIRGTHGSEKFVILLNGVSISSPSGEGMPIMENYPVHLAEQIEVVYGPASALYGANATSGVINIITKKPSKNALQAEASLTGGTHGYTNSTIFLAKKIRDGVDFVIAGQYSYDKGADYSKLYSDDPMLSVAGYTSGTVNTIFGPMTPVTPMRAKYEAPMEASNVYASLRLDNFSFSVFRNDFKLPTAFGNNTSNALYNKEAYMAQNITNATASYRTSIDKLTSATSFMVSQYNLQPSSNYRNLYTGMEPAYKYSTNTMIRLEEQLDYKANNKWNLSTGIAYEHYNGVPQSADLTSPVNTKEYIKGSYVGTQAYYRPEGLAAQFYYVKYHNIGGYVQTQYSPSEKLNFTIGSRYDFNSRYGSAVSPRLGLVYRPTENTTIKVLYGNAFFAPSASTSYVQYGSFYTTDSGRSYRSSFLHLPNPGLKPVTSKNVELNVRQDLSNNFVVTADIYYTFLKGLLHFSDDNATTKLYNNNFNGIPVDYIEVFTNNNRQMNYGGSIQLNWKYSAGKLKIHSYGSVSYVDGKVEKGLEEKNEDEKDIELDFISHFMARLGTDLRLGKFTCSPRLTLMGEQHISGIQDTTGRVIKRQSIPGYALLNVSLRYNATKKVSVYVNVSNALNQRYRNVGFNMDLNNPNTDLFYGQRQDPIRIMGGLNISL